MPAYGGIQKEETLKGLVHDDYFFPPYAEAGNQKMAMGTDGILTMCKIYIILF
jgi:hypothetical protein